jgi:hypothetical protein
VSSHKEAQKLQEISALLLLLLFVHACHRSAQKPAITLKYNVTPQPLTAGLATIDVELRYSNGQPVSGARVELEGNMSHPGMSPVSGVATEIESGKYRGILQLTMAGDWIVLVNVTLSDGEQLQDRLELNGVRSNQH